MSRRRDECSGKQLWGIGLFKDAAFSKAAFQELQARGLSPDRRVEVEADATEKPRQ